MGFNDFKFVLVNIYKIVLEIPLFPLSLDPQARSIFFLTNYELKTKNKIRISFQAQ
jgi:hypothetical protein